MSMSVKTPNPCCLQSGDRPFHDGIEYSGDLGLEIVGHADLLFQMAKQVISVG
jgi:hypothetical protein